MLNTTVQNVVYTSQNAFITSILKFEKFLTRGLLLVPKIQQSTKIQQSIQKDPERSSRSTKIQRIHKDPSKPEISTIQRNAPKQLKDSRESIQRNAPKLLKDFRKRSSFQTASDVIFRNPGTTPFFKIVF